MERAFFSQTLPLDHQEPNPLPPWHLFIPHLLTEHLLCAGTGRLWRYVIEQDSRPCPQRSQGILWTPPHSALVHFDSFRMQTREIDKWIHYERFRKEIPKKSSRLPETQNLGLRLGLVSPLLSSKPMSVPTFSCPSRTPSLSVFLKEWFSSHCIRIVPLGLLKNKIQNIQDTQKTVSTGCL